jgi:hypothetical protein
MEVNNLVLEKSRIFSDFFVEIIVFVTNIAFVYQP